jgi:hypothetical protein
VWTTVYSGEHADRIPAQIALRDRAFVENSSRRLYLAAEHERPLAPDLREAALDFS